jgi:hypothetical protein
MTMMPSFTTAFPPNEAGAFAREIERLAALLNFLTEPPR